MKKFLLQMSLFIFCLFFYLDKISSNDKKMKIYAYKPELFHKINDMTSEQKVYQLLSIHPIEKNINYLAVPWGVLFRQKKLQIKLPARLNGGFSVCQHIRYRDIIPVLKKLGINILFAPHASKQQQYKEVKVLPFPLYPVNSVESAKKKDILYSFIGYESHPTRRKIFSLAKHSDIIIKRRGRWHFYLRKRGNFDFLRWSLQRERERREYQSVLARSRFSLCPRGSGPSTIRFWESLRAGAIPILLSDAMALPKIEGINWNDCMIQMPENRIASVDHLIRSIPLEKEQTMRENCLQVYALLCAGENFIHTIREYFEKQLNTNRDLI